MTDKVYVSITGLELTSAWHIPRFWYYALRSMTQARRSRGNVTAQARQMNGVQHTLTTWKSRADMLAFVHSGTHARAIAIFPEIATGKTYGYMADAPPAWPEIPALWRANGKDYRTPSSAK